MSTNRSRKIDPSHCHKSQEQDFHVNQIQISLLLLSSGWSHLCIRWGRDKMRKEKQKWLPGGRFTSLNLLTFLQSPKEANQSWAGRDWESDESHKLSSRKIHITWNSAFNFNKAIKSSRPSMDSLEIYSPIWYSIVPCELGGEIN